MANVGVTFDFAAESAKLRSEIDKVRKELGTLNATAKGIGDGFKALGGIVAGAFSIGAVTAFLSRVNQAADQLNDLSGRLGASASGLQTLQVAAQQAGGSAEAMQTALAKLSTTIGDGLAGNKQAVEAFDRLGLSARELATLKADEAMERVSTALSGVSNTYERASIAQDIFGKGAKDLAGFFADAPGAIGETEAALAAAGATLDDLDVAKIGVMNDQLAMQGTIVQNLGTKFLANLSPAVGVATDAFADMIGNMGGATQAGKTFGVIVTAAIKMVETAVYGLAAVFESIRFVVASVMAGITTAVGEIISLVASAAEAVNLGFADELRAASDTAIMFGESLATVGASAQANAQAAASAAMKAGAEVFNAATIFDEAAAKLETRAASITAGIQSAQGAVGAGVAGAGTAAADRARGGPILSRETEKAIGKDLAAIDPLSDPAVLAEMAKNQVLQDLQDQHAATMLGKLEAFNQTALGSFLNYNSLVAQSEQNKNATLGEGMNMLVQAAINQGGKLGKIGKAIAIAQTIWSTGQAVMKAYAEVPWPGNIAAAAGVAAQGIAQLANIKKTNVGSGGSIVGAKGGGIQATSPALAAPTSLSDNVPGTQKAEQQTVAQVVINGNVFSSQETADWLIDQLREAISRDVVFINGGSRQAMELAGMA